MRDYYFGSTCSLERKMYWTNLAEAQPKLLNVKLHFDEDIFGPSKVMQLLSAQGRLPAFYQLERRTIPSGWLVRVDLEDDDLNRILLSKFEVIYGLIDMELR